MEEEKKTKEYFVVMRIFQYIEGTIMPFNIDSATPLRWEVGMFGALPVFESREAATKAYPDDSVFTMVTYVSDDVEAKKWR